MLDNIFVPILILLTFIFLVLLEAEASYNICGVPPTPPAGCYVGQCVNGSWQIICELEEEELL